LGRYFLYATLGLGAGAFYAVMAQAVLIGYKASGLINFGQAAMAMISAYVFTDLRNNGHLMVFPLPNPLKLIQGLVNTFGGHLHWPSIHTSIRLGHSFSFWPAFLIAVLYGVILGQIIYWLIFRPLRYASMLSKLAASVGVMLTLQSIAVVRYGTDSVQVPNALPTGDVRMFGQSVPTNQMALAGIAVALTVLIVVLYRRTRFGLATEAASLDERGAIISGINTNHLAATNWLIASLLGASIGTLFASTSSLNPESYTLYIAPALGAILIGNFVSFRVTAITGMAIAILQSWLTPLQLSFSWIPKVGAVDGIPFLVIIVAMIVRGRGLPARGSLTPPRLPISREPRHITAWAVGLAVIAVLALLFFPYYLRAGVINSLAYILLGLSVVVLTGMAGQVSLMQVAIAGVAALVMTRLAGEYGLPFPLAPILAAVLAAIVGVLAGSTALRIRGVNLAIVTLGAAVVFESMVLGDNSLVGGKYAQAGAIKTPKIFGLAIDINERFPFGPRSTPNWGFGLFELVVVIAACVFVARLRRSKTGRAFLAVRVNERSAAASGLNVPMVKALAFGIAGLLAGLAGALSTYRFQGMNAPSFDALASVEILAVVYLGGVSSVGGAIAAGVLYSGGVVSALNQHLFNLGQYEYVFAGVGLIIMAVQNPDGIMVLLGDQLRRVVHLPQLSASNLWQKAGGSRVPGLAGRLSRGGLKTVTVSSSGASMAEEDTATQDLADGLHV
jgi:ABC-type branched-subunit amino acid transport system permease subunit